MGHIQSQIDKCKSQNRHEDHQKRLFLSKYDENIELYIANMVQDNQDQLHYLHQKQKETKSKMEQIFKEATLISEQGFQQKSIKRLERIPQYGRILFKLQNYIKKLEERQIEFQQYQNELRFYKGYFSGEQRIFKFKELQRHIEEAERQKRRNDSMLSEQISCSKALENKADDSIRASEIYRKLVKNKQKQKGNSFRDTNSLRLTNQQLHRSKIPLTNSAGQFNSRIEQLHRSNIPLTNSTGQFNSRIEPNFQMQPQSLFNVKANQPRLLEEQQSPVLKQTGSFITLQGSQQKHILKSQPMVFFPYKQIIINPKRPSIIHAPQYKGNVDPVSRININLGPSCVSNNSNIDTRQNMDRLYGSGVKPIQNSKINIRFSNSRFISNVNHGHTFKNIFVDGNKIQSIINPDELQTLSGQILTSKIQNSQIQNSTHGNNQNQNNKHRNNQNPSSQNQNNQNLKSNLNHFQSNIQIDLFNSEFSPSNYINSTYGATYRQWSQNDRQFWLQKHAIHLNQNGFFLNHANSPIRMQEFIKYDWTELQCANLENSGIDDKTLTILADNIWRFPQLKILWIAKNNISKVQKGQIFQFSHLRMVNFGASESSPTRFYEETNLYFNGLERSNIGFK